MALRIWLPDSVVPGNVDDLMDYISRMILTYPDADLKLKVHDYDRNN